MKTPYIHNPGMPGEAATLRSRAKPLDTTEGVRTFLTSAVCRIVGGVPSDYGLFEMGPKFEEMNEDDNLDAKARIYLYDDEGNLAVVTILNRAIEGGVYALCRDLTKMNGPVGTVLSGVVKSLGVSPAQVTLWAEEDAFGRGRVEWSVNQ